MEPTHDTTDITLHPAAPDSETVEPILKDTEPAHMPVLRQLSVALVLLTIILGASYARDIVSVASVSSAQDVTVERTVAPVSTPTVVVNPFADVSIAARSAIVWDVRAGRPLFMKHADTVLPLASITKLMTALVAYELLDDTDTVSVSLDAVRTDGDSGLTDGEVFTLKDLTDMVLVASSNDGAVALAEGAAATVDAPGDLVTRFVTAMNIRAAQLGLAHTHFENPTGLDLSTDEPGAVSTAREVALLLEYIVTTYPQIAALTTVDATHVFNAEGAYHEVENTNEIVSAIDGLIASKTGYTTLAGGNLAVAFDAALNRPIIVVVLGSTFNGRFSDVETLVERTRSYLAGTTTASH